MNVVLFGANGRVGSLVCSELLSRGHKVRAFVHGSLELSHENLTVFKGDIYDTDSVLRALDGMDVVVSALGSWGTARKDILGTAMAAIIPAMKANGQSRIISLTGTAAHKPHEKIGLSAAVDRILLKCIDRKVLHDGELHLRLLSESSLDWTVLRSPIMNNKGDSRYVLNEVLTLPFATINRKAVALAMVDIVEQDTWHKSAPCIHRP